MTSGPVDIGLLANGFPDSVAFLDQVQAALAEALPEARFHRWDKGNASIQAPDAMLGRDHRPLLGGDRRLRPLRLLHNRHRA